jgi:amino acid permease
MTGQKSSAWITICIWFSSWSIQEFYGNAARNLSIAWATLSFSL